MELFWGPEMATSKASAIWAPKSRDFQGPPLLTPRVWTCTHPNHNVEPHIIKQADWYFYVHFRAHCQVSAPHCPEVVFLKGTVWRRPQVNLRSRARCSNAIGRGVQPDQWRPWTRALDLRLTWGLLPTVPFKESTSGSASERRSGYFCVFTICTHVHRAGLQYFRLDHPTPQGSEGGGVIRSRNISTQ